MKIIENGNSLVHKVWGNQKININRVYRLMKYIYRVDNEGKTFLHNVVTGQLVILEPAEISLLEMSPIAYSEEMKALVEHHFLVPEDYDEHKEVNNLRLILRKLNQPKTNDIVNYTILPTTACNARCYYCFEAGIKNVTMTENTAQELIDFISKNCGEQKKIHITWFGGEPTVAWKIIDFICNGLIEKEIEYSSKMITNGYLLDEKLVEKAKNLWKVTSLQLTVDGTEENYNRIKNYIVVDNNPYKKILHNVGVLIKNEIFVSLRMNFDSTNYLDFKGIVEDVYNTYGFNPYLRLVVHPIETDFKNNNHENETWFNEKIIELTKIAKDKGYVSLESKLPSLVYNGCRASTNSAITVTPEGNLVKCPEQLTKSQVVGTLQKGITNMKLVNDWKQFADYERCRVCFHYPACERLLLCDAKDKCNNFLKYKNDINDIVLKK